MCAQLNLMYGASAEIIPNLAVNIQILICGHGLDRYPFKHKSYLNLNYGSCD